MALRRIGFFREQRHGDEAGPSLRDAVAEPLAVEHRAAVAQYLQSGSVLAATSERTDDALDPTRRDVSGINVCTDGDYVWSQDLAYYVRVYGAGVPDDLVARALKGPPPELSIDELVRLADDDGPSEA